MEKPSRALIVRSFQKDGIYLQKLQNILSKIFDPFIEDKNRLHFLIIIDAFSKLIYYMSSTARSLQTIGEEYTSLITVRSAGNNQLRVPSSLVLKISAITQSISQAFARTFIGILLKYLRLCRNASAERVQLLRIILNSLLVALGALNSALFYLTGDGYRLAHRLLGISYVSISPGSSGDHFSTALFKIIGIINAMRSISEVFKSLKSLIQLFGTPEIVGSTTHNSSASSDHKIGASNCSLCLENPCVAPTAAICGHVFCWECIIDSTRVLPECPLCRTKCHPSRLIYLYNA